MVHRGRTADVAVRLLLRPEADARAGGPVGRAAALLGLRRAGGSGDHEDDHVGRRVHHCAGAAAVGCLAQRDKISIVRDCTGG